MRAFFSVSLKRFPFFLQAWVLPTVVLSSICVFFAVIFIDKFDFSYSDFKSLELFSSQELSAHLSEFSKINSDKLKFKNLNNTKAIIFGLLTFLLSLLTMIVVLRATVCRLRDLFTIFKIRYLVVYFIFGLVPILGYLTNLFLLLAPSKTLENYKDF